MVIQHNLGALRAYHVQVQNQSQLCKTLEKLSTGYRINWAADDASGLAVSEKMRAQITGLERAKLNVKDALSLVQTADGALAEQQELLRRMKYLAVQAADGIYDHTDRESMQMELDACLEEIDRIACGTNFNGITLLRTEQAQPPGPEEPLPPPVTSEIPEESVIPDTVQPDPIHKEHSVPVPQKPAQLAAPSGNAAVTSTPIGIWITTSGVYQIPSSFSGTIEIKPGLDVKLVQAAPATVLSDVYVRCGAGTNLFIENFNLEMGDDRPLIAFAGDGTLSLCGTNTLKGFDYAEHAMIETDEHSSLTVNEAQGENATLTLSVGEGAGGAGIGGSSMHGAGDITIAGGHIKIDLPFFNEGAGIGSGGRGSSSGIMEGPSGSVTILGGTIDVQAEYSNGAAIGSGTGIGVRDMTVAGGDIKLRVTTAWGAGIGGATESRSGDIQILSGNIDIEYDGDGAAIGSGMDGKAGTILIEGDDSTNIDIVIHDGFGGGAAIGSGGEVSTDDGIFVDAIVIRGGNINVGSDMTGDAYQGALIGSGSNLDNKFSLVGKISIEGGNITASTPPGSAGAAIGGGAYTDGGVIDISGGKINVSAGAGALGSAIGGGGDEFRSDVGAGADLTVSGGEVTVTGGWIGGGTDTSGIQGGTGSVRVTGGNLTAADIRGGINSGASPLPVLLDGAPWLLQPNETVAVTVNDVRQLWKADLDGKLMLYLLLAGNPPKVEVRTQEHIYAGTVAAQDDGTFALELEYKGPNVKPQPEPEPEPGEPAPPDTPDVPDAPGTLYFQVGAGAEERMQFCVRDMRAASLGVADIRFSSAEQADEALVCIDKAIEIVSGYRGYCGARQNRLEHTMAGLESTAENLIQAESRIRDTDMAQGMMRFVRQDIASQASVAMLAQAQAAPQKVLELLK